ncbi:MAG: bifunctional UDP-N-acetylmuramoyl-tripeptide:D-alanyl-D-alanine ligase/alanine racemase [Prevotellaceae bacterium]|nr:bifunctional UDP-N-acetylmuramoyl-tripeptide:D-alanyl-D-alanine ligase/alanine racemase [Prevotellaceae bacterium]
MKYTISQIASIINATIAGKKTGEINEIITDSRANFSPEGVLFFAMVGVRHNGHIYIKDLYSRGLRAFVVSENVDAKEYSGATFLQVENTLEALHKMAAYHRKQYLFPVVGITGSNGKTIVKEWIAQLLIPQIKVVRSPKSYNSQVGVPLSVWQMNERNELGLFEAGISLPNEMDKLEAIIRPNVVVITNIGEAHQEGFASRDQKLREKLKLCANADAVVYCADHFEIHTAVRSMQMFGGKRIFCWGHNPEADLRVVSSHKSGKETTLTVRDQAQREYKLTIPFVDNASEENAMHSFAACLFLSQLHPELNLNIEAVKKSLSQLSPVAMRLDLREGINGCTIINDAYTADIPSLRIALDFLSSFSKHRQRTIILSDIEQSGKEDWRLYGEVADLLREKSVTRLIGIGRHIAEQTGLFDCEKLFFEDAEQFLQRCDKSIFRDEAILVKGSRHFELEKISHQLEQKTHLTTLDINMTALVDNLNMARAKLSKGTKALVLVKAFAYGAGISEVARLLQHQRVDYLGVAFADEGITLREAGITMPILVLNPEPGTFDQMINYKLEPEIYNRNMLHRFAEAVTRAGESIYPIHVKLDTGMHRLGFLESEVEQLVKGIQQRKNLRVASIFSHLAAADEKRHDSFTRKQIALFDTWSKQIQAALGYTAIRHLINSAGIERFPQAQFDMVRLGISFYGVSAGGKVKVRTVSTLKSTIVQIKNIPANETIGYGRKGVAHEHTRIALVPVGYADGYNRKLSNGVGKMFVNGKQAPVIGNICMDMCMVDISGIEANEGDEVEIFGENISVVAIAEKLETIPYEIFTRISPRVRRVYFNE